MRLFIFVLGGLLMTAGAISVGLGIDFIQIERGWTQVIAGATVLASGAICLAIGCVVVKLEQLRRDLLGRGDIPAAAPAASQVAAAPIAAAPIAAAHGHGSDRRLADEVADHPTVPLDLGLADRGTMREGEHRNDAESGHRSGTLAGQRHGSVAARPEGGPSIAADAEESKPSADTWPPAQVAVSRPEEDPSNTADADESEPRADAWPAPPVPAAQPELDWLERALAGVDEPSVEPPSVIPFARSARVRSAEPAVEQDTAGADSVEHGGAGDTVRQPARSFAEPLPRETTETAIRAQGPSADPGLLPPAPAEPAIMGRYQANGNSYVMFSDGSIEAETPTGVYRFTSMNELKAFIEGAI